MEVTISADPEYIVNHQLFDDQAAIQERVDAAPTQCRAAIKRTLRYLYLSNGPGNLTRDDLKAAIDQLTVAEQKVVKWLQTRTNGSLRSTYGKEALLAAREAKYQCHECGFPDVRVLNLDHVEGRRAGTSFRCLCANCHHIKSSATDWS